MYNELSKEYERVFEPVVYIYTCIYIHMQNNWKGTTGLSLYG